MQQRCITYVLNASESRFVGNLYTTLNPRPNRTFWYSEVTLCFISSYRLSQHFCNWVGFPGAFYIMHRTICVFAINLFRFREFMRYFMKGVYNEKKVMIYLFALVDKWATVILVTTHPPHTRAMLGTLNCHMDERRMVICHTIQIHQKMPQK